MRMSQNSRVLRSWVMAGRRGVRVVAEDALGGVGGFEGRIKEGRAAIVAYGDFFEVRCVFFFFFFLIAFGGDVCDLVSSWYFWI
jgi:hypothetical protein